MRISRPILWGWSMQINLCRVHFAFTAIPLCFALAFFAIANQSLASQPGSSEVAGVVRVSGSGAAPAKKIGTKSKSRKRRFFSGFSIAPSYGTKWKITRKDRTGITFFKKPSHRRKHTVIAFTSSMIVSPPLETFASFIKSVEKMEKLAESDKRYRDYSYDISTVRVRNKKCVRTDFSTIDQGVPYDRKTQYMLKGFNIYCLHPDSPGTAIVIGFSQRYAKGLTPLGLKSKMRQLVESFRFEKLKE